MESEVFFYLNGCEQFFLGKLFPVKKGKYLE